MSNEKKFFLNSFKRNAKLLNTSFDVVSNTLNTPFKAPTYTQCLEISARALGFKTFKGLTLSDLTEVNEIRYLSDFDKTKLIESYLDVNRKKITTMPLKIDSSLDLNSTIDAVCTLAYHIQTFPLLRDFYLPKRYLSKHLDFDKGPFTINDTLSKICAHWCISLLIEKPKGYEFYKGVYENNNDILYDVPMSFFTKKKINDWYKSRDFLHDFTDLFQHCDFIRVQSGWTDFDNMSNSKINIFIPPALHERITELVNPLKGGPAN
ncbi:MULTISPECIES: hypothetical protein [Acinetobacter calcoaceticus/baumannii complex]|jgi:hypothetical protein|uniref:Uncharacterized protein n=9 Tax=Acinetobacter calcoaceticus/baumannii complex TaxID=909768 RepID=A0A1E3M4P3_ACIBA|nr:MULTISPECIES: hypothetical protein [Acinetobacter calcoaceticus/baumannii complex]CAH1090732.1 Uncharacterised protein [Acinetobacter phage MD-2021a]ABS89936.2 hypothetical protein A1S_3511 [Acinetobacter baumannii ATCC 17978]AKQ28822.1 hypothetical protein ACX60_18915 [Acinetobacter baumannii]APP30830.1 hypothetical protein AUO97_08410 [Acinetobacter baumannii]APX49299.1 hypothetical protein AT570_08405 [Acinetobacter baumannii]